MQQLVQTQPNAVSVDAAKCERLLNRLFKLPSGLGCVKLENLDKLTNAATVGPLLT